jgi:hypothetical protein
MKLRPVLQDRDGSTVRQAQRPRRLRDVTDEWIEYSQSRSVAVAELPERANRDAAHQLDEE